MRKTATCLGLLLAALAALPSPANGAAEPIRSVEIGRNRKLRVNGKPFLPIMLFAQSAARIPDGVSINANVFAGGGGRRSGGEYLDQLGQNGLYGVMGFNEGIADNPHLLGWIHGDEPDMPRRVSDANIVVGEGTRATRDGPLHRIVDGQPQIPAKIEPLEGGEFTIKLAEPGTAVSLAITLPLAENREAAKDVQFLADGKEVLKVTLQKSTDRQEFDLKQPVTFSDLTVRILSIYPGEPQFRSIAEVEAFDKDGVNLLLCETHLEPRQAPDAVA